MKLQLIVLVLFLSTISVNAQQIDKKTLSYEKTGAASMIGFKVKASSPDIDLATKDFLNKNKDIFKIETSNLKELKRYENSINNKDFKVIIYQQIYNNLPVFNSYVVSAAIGNNINLIRNKYHPNVLTKKQKSLSEKDAFDIIKSQGPIFINQILNYSQSYNLPNNPEKTTLGILPAESKKNIDYNLAYKVDLPLKNDHKFTFYIDASDGQVLDVYDNVVYEDVSGQVTGEIYPEYFNQTKIVVNFPYEYINVSNLKSVTDLSGNYIISNLPAVQSLFSSKLHGPWVTVGNYRQPEASYSSSISVPSIQNLNWQSYDTSYKQEESNVYYHANVIHDYAVSLGVSEMNAFTMSANVNKNSYCNAFYSSNSINFFAAGGYCEATSLGSDTVYHEYGHGIQDQLIRIYWPYSDHTGNMNEGLSDYWACTINNNACMSEYFYSFRQCLRRCDTQDRYPDNYRSEPHSGAQIISGALWQIRNALGKSTTDRMVVNALRLQPYYFTDLLENMLIVDDDNQNLLDGTPNIVSICDAFYDHGIFSRYCSGFTSKPIAVVTKPDFTDIIYDKTIMQVKGIAAQSKNGIFQNYLLEYGVGTAPTSWTTIASGPSPVADSILGNWDVSNLQTNQYTLKLTVTDSLAQSTFSYTYYVDKNIIQNWPVYTNSKTYAPLVLADLNNDGIDEIISSFFGNTQIHSSSGVLLYNLSSGYNMRPPAVADINDDGYQDIIIMGKSNILNIYNGTSAGPKLYKSLSVPILNYDQHRYASAPVLYDLDNDGALEIIQTGESGKVYVLTNKLANFNSQWPKDLGQITVATPAVGDLDGDGIAEIIVLTRQNKLYAWKSDGTLLNNFPITLPTLTADSGLTSPVVADLNYDGNQEIYVSSDNYVYAVNYDGNYASGWPIVFPATYIFQNEVTIADFNNDKNPKIIFLFPIGNFKIFTPAGQQVSGYYESSGAYPKSSPVISDINNNNKLKLIYPNSLAKITIMESSSNYWYLPLSYTIEPQPASLGNLDSDPDLELAIIDNYGTIYAWKIDNLGDGNTDWQQFHHDTAHTGNYDFNVISSLLKNKGSLALYGYLTLRLQKDDNGIWSDYQIVENNVYKTIPPGNNLNLASIWNSHHLTLPAGNYRAISEFKDASGNILQTTTGLMSSNSDFTVITTSTSTTSTSTSTTPSSTSTSTSTSTTSTMLGPKANFTPIADSYVSKSSPTSNYGTATIMFVNGPPSYRIAYLKFNVNGINGQIQSAKLFIRPSSYCNSPGGNSTNPCTELHFVQDNSWTETGITWNNKPTIDSARLSSLTIVNFGIYFTLPIPGVINGNGIYSFAINSTSADDVAYYSKENIDYLPKLQVTFI